MSHRRILFGAHNQRISTELLREWQPRLMESRAIDLTGGGDEGAEQLAFSASVTPGLVNETLRLRHLCRRLIATRDSGIVDQHCQWCAVDLKAEHPHVDTCAWWALVREVGQG